MHLYLLFISVSSLAEPKMIEVVQDSKSRALTPKYDIIREPPDGKPEFLVIEINLPGIVSKDK